MNQLLPIDMLRHFFALDTLNKPEYRGFVQIPDLFLKIAGKPRFDAPSDWEEYLANKDAMLRKALALPCLRHVKNPPMIADELEFMDMKAILGPSACYACGEMETRYDEPRLASCISCGRSTVLDAGCVHGHHVCGTCVALHLDKPACPKYQTEKKCHGRDCTLLT